MNAICGISSGSGVGAFHQRGEHIILSTPENSLTRITKKSDNELHLSPTHGRKMDRRQSMSGIISLLIDYQKTYDEQETASYNFYLPDRCDCDGILAGLVLRFY